MKPSNFPQNLEDRALDDLVEADQRRAALGHVSDAFAEALLEGLDAECCAHAAIHAGLQHLVDMFGEETTARLAADLPERLRAGEFSVPLWH